METKQLVNLAHLKTIWMAELPARYQSSGRITILSPDFVN